MASQQHQQPENKIYIYYKKKEKKKPFLRTMH